MLSQFVHLPQDMSVLRFVCHQLLLMRTVPFLEVRFELASVDFAILVLLFLVFERDRE